MSDLTNLSITDARDGLLNKEFSSLELTKAFLTSMESQKHLNAFISETPELALSQAKQADLNIADGKSRGLEGIPIGIKDLFCTKGVLTTAASHILDGFIPPYDSEVSANIMSAGAVMLGKTNLDEFAMGSSNETSYYGAVKNPWKSKENSDDLVPGGSSGGSAAAVAARMAMAALGTDTGGSIRQPASFCGIVGLKPTYGRCSRWGIIAFSSSLDQAGPMTQNVRDASVMLTVMAGHDKKDSTSVNMPVPDYESALTGNIKGLRVGIPSEYRLEGLDSEVSELWERGAKWLADAGAEIIDVTLPHTKYSLPCYYIIAPAEASSNLARYDGVRFGLRVDSDSLDEMYSKTRETGFGAEVKRRIMIGTYALSAGYYDAYYLKAQKVRRLISQDFDNAFKDVDVILTPTTPTAAFPIGKNNADPISMYLNDVFTVPASLSGIPGVSVPAGLSKSGLPLGLQILANRWDEETLLKVADVVEDSADFNRYSIKVGS
ncbi:MAG: Asp-tRNA(Asn)/Glu-tRNA(Gln) amidotransferase GatCAB subunit A [Rhodospirillaceae bacterium]|nr:Asp-tRNA(Asn)/Glu-tRNA(Gln) amidotransferase GatCAB subunit A [Rhodospirillaceae bacterium]